MTHSVVFRSHMICVQRYFSIIYLLFIIYNRKFSLFIIIDTKMVLITIIYNINI